MIDAFQDIRGLLEVGGSVLLAIFFVTIVLWTLIIERFYYVWFEYPQVADATALAWDAMEEKNCWDAQVIRRMWISERMMDLDRGLAMIRSLVSVCPLLGLLGTTTGMIEVYEVMSVAGNGEPKLVAAGVSQAMITTMAGLIVALSGIFFSARLENRLLEEHDRLTARLHIDEDLLAHHHHTRSQKAKARARIENQRRRARRDRKQGKPTETTDEIAEWIAEHGILAAGPDEVEWIQTHISHVFLVGDRVYKLRKSVTLPFLDFGTREARNADCVREVTLNRRLAPDVYLGVVSLRLGGEGLEIGPASDDPTDPDLEHAVLMRRLPEGRDALALLQADALTVEQLERVATLLARFHEDEGLGRPAPWTRDEWRSRIEDPMADCVDTIADAELLSDSRLEGLHEAVDRAGEVLAPAFERRRVEGRAIDAHGDLHLDHVWFETEAAAPLLVDCLEFDDDLRRIDRAAEVAFLAMDLAYRDREDLAESFLAAYVSASDDYGLYAVVDYFAAYRALVRAKVAALASTQVPVASAQRRAARDSALRHIGLAEHLLEERAGAAISLTCGTVGSGKSSVARARARAEGCVLISSDPLRKRLAGLADADRRGDATDAGLYAPERRTAVYEAMLERAEQALASGRHVMLDASFSSKADRDRVRLWAEERGLAARLIEVRCDPEIARERLAARERAGEDASDAGPDFLPISIERFDAPDEWPTGQHEVVRTDDAPSDAVEASE